MTTMSQSMRPDAMYKFESNVIDLTGSSPTQSGASPNKWRSTNIGRLTTSASGAGIKKLTVKNLKHNPSSNPDRYYCHIWSQLGGALDAIFSQNTKPFSMEELYRGVENICRQDKAPYLFNELELRCKRHVTEEIRPLLVKNTQDYTNEQALRSITEAWAVWRQQVVWRHVLTSLKYLHS